MSRPLLVGLAPSRDGDPSRPLVGRGSGDRLMSFCHLTLREYVRGFDRVNLLDDWPGYANGKGDHVPSLADRRVAAARVMVRARGRRVVFLGNAVAEAFGFVGAAYGWTQPFWPFAGAAKVPHPSAVSRKLNDPMEQRRFRRFLRKAMAEA